jgi:hypothetical protein
MQSSQQKKNKSGLSAAKIIIGIVSITGTFGLWNLFAAKPAPEVKPPEKNTNDNQQQANSLVLEFPPLPTLVPVRTSDVVLNPVENTTNVAASGLRQVSQPTPAPVVNNSKPVFEQITINRPGSSSSSSSSSSSGSSR